MDTSIDAARICARYARLKADRAQFESVWQEVGDYIRPLRADFVTKRAPGEKRYGKVFDSTALLAADNFAGGLYGMMSNPTNRWFALRVPDDDLNAFEPVRDWLEAVENIMFHSFGPQVSRFYSVLPGMYADLACFGNSVFYSEEAPGFTMINDNVRALGECVFAEDGWGQVDTVYRRFTLEARQALQLFPDGLSDRTLKAANDAPFTKIWFVHCVEPDGEYDAEKLGAKPFASIYVEEEARNVVARKGYYEFPYQVPRWSQAAGEVYGRGLGEAALADVKTVNQQSRTSLVAAQKAADPPLLAPDKGVIEAARTFPGGITYGGVNAQGQRLVQPLITGADVRITLEMMEQRRTAIREAFYFSLMQMVGSPDMTATEWMGRQEEKLRLMGPNLGRIQSEFLSPLIKRRFGMLHRGMMLPPPPAEIQGHPLNVEYVSPLARAQLAGEAQAVVRLYQSVLPLAQADPSIMDNIDNDVGVAVLARGYAVPAKLLRGPEKVAALRQSRQQKEQMAQGLAMAHVAAGAAKDGAQAGKSVSQARLASAQAEAAGAPKMGLPGATPAGTPDKGVLPFAPGAGFPLNPAGGGKGGGGQPNLAAIIDQLRGALRQNRAA